VVVVVAVAVAQAAEAGELEWKPEGPTPTPSDVPTPCYGPNCDSYRRPYPYLPCLARHPYLCRRTSSLAPDCYGPRNLFHRSGWRVSPRLWGNFSSPHLFCGDSLHLLPSLGVQHFPREPRRFPRLVVSTPANRKFRSRSWSSDTALLRAAHRSRSCRVGPELGPECPPCQVGRGNRPRASEF
jgi:hypothetical protein